MAATSEGGSARRERNESAGLVPVEPVAALWPRLADLPAERRGALGWLGIAGLVGASYYPSLWGGFVWDDVIFAEEPVIHAVSGLWSIWTAPADISNEGHYWPIVYTTFWLEHKLWGLWPVGYHAVNMALHAVNSALVWRLCERLGVPGAWLVGAVFAVHPVHVESVAWIIERKDLLSALFYLGAALAWLRFADTSRLAHYALALALYVAGMLSKSIVVTLPAALLLWQWWRRGTLTSWDIARVVPFLVAGLGIALADYQYYDSRETVDLGYSLLDRLLIAAQALWFYAGKLAWPMDLAVIYPLWRIDAASVLAWAAVAGAAAAASCLWMARLKVGRGPLAAAAFFAVTLSPVLGFVDFGYMQFSFVADRFQYLASLGLLGLVIAGGVVAASRLHPTGRIAAAALAATVVATLSTLTWHQAGIYRDEIALFGHIVEHNPQARDAHLNLGSALFEAGRVEEGLEASLIAAELRPDFAGPFANIGRGYLAQGRMDDAEEALGRALELDPRNLSALQNLAEAHRRQNRMAEAEAGYRAVLGIDGDYALAHAGLGHVLAQTGRHEDGLAHMARALAVQPGLAIGAALQVAMGRSARELDRLDEAEAHFAEAARLREDSAEPLLELAALHEARGQVEEAARYRTGARDLVAGNPVGLHALAESLRQSARADEAIDVYREALAVDADFAPAHAGLGLALFQLRRYRDAVDTMSRALTLDPDLPVAAPLHVYSGHSLRELGEGAAAAARYEAALALDADNAEALDNLAKARFEAGRYEDAVALYRRLAAVNPSSAVTRSNLGAALHRLGRNAEALEHLDAALDLDPDLALARTGREAVRQTLAAPPDAAAAEAP